ncbi:unnamed protein product [Lupinus luteus]|uniref:Uncharacterized protein n=1 Tax=Lupinus luteus TaxID=3873 RepID=A0AAV1WDA4_LUPLU
MAVAYNVGTKIDSSSQNLDNNVVSSETIEVEKKSKPVNSSLNGDQNLNDMFNHHDGCFESEEEWLQSGEAKSQ